MTTMPEKSTPNWSTVKPTFEDVKGIFILVEYDDNGSHETQVTVIGNTDYYKYWFDDGFIRYAILDLSAPDPEPKELWGKKANVIETKQGYYVKGRTDDDYNKSWILETPMCPTKPEAILAWNKIADALEGVQL